MSTQPTSPSARSPFIALEMLGRSVRRVERGCCAVLIYIPLIFVYGMTLWAAVSTILVGREPGSVSWLGNWTSGFAIAIFVLLNWSYTTAVFTSPGSTTGNGSDGYNLLPTVHSPTAASLTVKSNGETRYCKKCQARKPDRAHHCSTCRRCVLKMDHHCPWLATCIGLRNHKAFLLFLIYATLLCLLSIATTGSYVWVDLLSGKQEMDPTSLLPINYIVVAVMSCMMALVIGAFAIWHILLAARGQTTIESLETKIRYLLPLQNSLSPQCVTNASAMLQDQPRHSHGQHLNEAPVNAVPELLRDGQAQRVADTLSSYGSSDCNTAPHGRKLTPRASYEDVERYRSHRRHEEYQDELDSSKLPNAFDLGWRRNLQHLFGPSPVLWALPVCNSIGDGWSWPANPKWTEARDRLRAEREQQRALERHAGWGCSPPTSPRGSGRSMMSARNGQSADSSAPAATPFGGRSASQALLGPAGWGTGARNLVTRQSRRNELDKPEESRSLVADEDVD